jgi:hypothetical protein
LEEEMTRFVKGKVDEVKKTVPRIVCLHRGENKLPPPDEDDKKNENPAAEAKEVRFRFYIRDEFSIKALQFQPIFFYWRSFYLPAGKTRLPVMVFKNVPAFRAFSVFV